MNSMLVNIFYSFLFQGYLFRTWLFEVTIVFLFLRTLWALSVDARKFLQNFYASLLPLLFDPCKGKILLPMHTEIESMYIASLKNTSRCNQYLPLVHSLWRRALFCSAAFLQLNHILFWTLISCWVVLLFLDKLTNIQMPFLTRKSHSSSMVFVHLALCNEFLLTKSFFYALHYTATHGKDVIVCNCLSWSVHAVLKIWKRIALIIGSDRASFITLIAFGMLDRFLNSFCYRFFVVFLWVFLGYRFLDSHDAVLMERQTVPVISVPEIF